MVTEKEWSLIVAVINAIGEISKQEAVDALERELFKIETGGPGNPSQPAGEP